MSNVNTQDNARSYTGPVEIGATVVAAFAAIAIIALLIGGNGLRIIDQPDGTEAMMSVTAEPSSQLDIDLGDPLRLSVDDSGAASVLGQAVVEIGDPLAATAHMLDPTASQRVFWLLWQVSRPLLALLIALPVRKMAKSARTGTPFTRQNERRLWRIAAIIGIGGVLNQVIASIAQENIVQRSAAADLFNVELTIDYTPMVIGMGVAALASIWHTGVTMSEELDATI